MNPGESAETIVRMTLQGTEYALKIVGSLTKYVVIGLIALSRSNGKTKAKGKTTLTKLLKSGQPLKVLGLKESDLMRFKQEAKKYGVLYAVVVNEQNKLDGMVDIIVRDMDASKVNRVIQRFGLSTYDGASIKSEIIKERDEKNSKDMDEMTINNADELLEEFFKPIQREENTMSNPNVAKTEKDHQSEQSLKNKKDSEVCTNSKSSVKEMVNNIKDEQKQKIELEESEVKNKTFNNETKHKQPIKKKKRKEKVK